MSIEIRLARTDDASAICGVLRRSIAELCEADHGNDLAFLTAWLANKTPENIAGWIVNPTNHFYVAVANGGIVGAACITSAGEINLNYVSPDARFKGVSSALLATLERKAAELGLPQCTLASTKTALQFYRSAGYRETTATTQRGTPMVKDLAGPDAAIAR